MPRASAVTILPKAIIAWRGIRGKMTQAQLADRAGVSEGLIALIETGRRTPSLSNAVAIARALDVEVHVIAVINDPDAVAEAAAS